MKGRERKNQPKHRKIVFYEDRHFFELTGNKFLCFRQTNNYARVSKPLGGGGGTGPSTFSESSLLCEM